MDVRNFKRFEKLAPTDDADLKELRSRLRDVTSSVSDIEKLLSGVSVEPQPQEGKVEIQKLLHTAVEGLNYIHRLNIGFLESISLYLSENKYLRDRRVDKDGTYYSLNGLVGQLKKETKLVEDQKVHLASVDIGERVNASFRLALDLIKLHQKHNIFLISEKQELIEQNEKLGIELSSIKEKATTQELLRLLDTQHAREETLMAAIQKWVEKHPEIVIDPVSSRNVYRVIETILDHST